MLFTESQIDCNLIYHLSDFCLVNQTNEYQKNCYLNFLCLYKFLKNTFLSSGTICTKTLNEQSMLNIAKVLVSFIFFKSKHHLEIIIKLLVNTLKPRQFITLVHGKEILWNLLTVACPKSCVCKKTTTTTEILNR